VVEINNVMARSFASFMQTGMTTLLNNANRTWQLPMGIFAQSIGIAMLPSLSAHHAAGETDAFRQMFNRGMRAVFLISLPLSFILLAEGGQIMRLLFKWGGSPEADVFYSGAALMGYSVALLCASLVGMTIRAFYAMHDSVTPLMAGLAGIAMNYLFNALFRHYAQIGIAGTSLAYSISAFLQMMVLLLLFSRKTGFPFFSDNIRVFGRSLVAMVPSAPVLWGLTLLLRPNPDSKLSQLVCATVPAVGCLAMYYFAARRLHIAEVSLLRDMIVNRLGGSRRRGGAASPRA
jgi:putative peptidoglycan lipid II flippase